MPIPIAVISGAKRGALRKRRYATRSINTLTITHTGMAAAMAITSLKMPGMSGAAVCMILRTVKPTIAPIINTSPWAKLIRLRTPYTIV
jgi:uncharacterized membrane protein